MSIRKTFILAASVLAMAVLPCTDSFGRQKVKRMVVIGLDGISVEGLEKANTPNLDILFKEGASTKTMRNVMPTITLPNWTSHLTGSGPEQHGVLSNKWTKESILLPPVVADADGYYPSVFTVIKEQFPECATGYVCDWKKLIYPINQKYLDKVFIATPDDYETVYKEGEQFIKDNKDNNFFLFLYAGFNDNTGHKYGWMSPEYIESLEKADVRIGEMFDMMKELGIFDDTYFLFITDHGGVEKRHGGNSPVEVNVPWALKGPAVKSGYVLEETSNTIDTSFLILDIFKLDAPQAWIGRDHPSVFCRKRR